MLSDVRQEAPKPVRKDSSVNTYESVRRTLDEALAELQLPKGLRGDDSGLISLQPVSR
jgi:hypothetical protein